MVTFLKVSLLAFSQYSGAAWQVDFNKKKAGNWKGWVSSENTNIEPDENSYAQLNLGSDSHL